MSAEPRRELLAGGPSQLQQTGAGGAAEPASGLGAGTRGDPATFDNQAVSGDPVGRGPADGRVCLCGALLSPLSMDQVVARAVRAIEGRARLAISVVNVAKLVNMRHDALLRESVEAGDVVLADGMPLVWLSRLCGRPLPGRVAGIDLMYRFFELADERQFRVYLLGARKEVLEAVVRVARERYPRMVLAGYRDGYFTDGEQEAVAGEVRDSRADILLVAMSSPKKEVFMRRWADSMAVPVTHGVGGSFDVMAGLTRRAPLWMQRCGLEWFYRFLQEPGRMWKRYLKTNLVFTYLAVRCLLGRDRDPGGGTLTSS